jgi:hypothetical protein
LLVSSFAFFSNGDRSQQSYTCTEISESDEV